MSVTNEATALPGVGPRVARSRRNVWWTGVVALAVVVVFFLLPYLVQLGTTAILDQAFVILTLASMWNLLAGYGGLVSVGQQAFLGLGAYFVLIGAVHGISPFLGLPLAAIGCGVAALPLWWLVSRLRTGYFAIGTWVLATAVALFVEQFQSIGGGTGMSLPLLARTARWCCRPTPTGRASRSPCWRWRACISCCAAGSAYSSRRSATMRPPPAARACGWASPACSSSWWRRSAAARPAPCWPSSNCRSCPRHPVACSASSGRPRWRSRSSSAGSARSRRPIIGTIIYMVLQQTLQQYNVWYLISLGLVAIAITLFARRGLWGLVDQHLGIRLFPVGYYLWPASERRGRRTGKA